MKHLIINPDAIVGDWQLAAPADIADAAQLARNSQLTAPVRVRREGKELTVENVASNALLHVYRELGL